MKTVVLDAGHGLYTSGKRTCDGAQGVVHEWSMNNNVCNYIAEMLGEYNDVQVLRVDDTSGNTDIALQTRVNRTNSINPDVFVSIHHNANTGSWGSWTGIEVYHHTYGSASDKRLASILAPKISTKTTLRNRGVKNAQFWVLTCRSNIPAVLCEGGYMDSTTDYPIITSSNGQKAYASGVVEGLVEFLGLTKKQVVPAIVYPYAEGTVVYPIEDITVYSTAGFSNSATGVIAKGTKCIIKKYNTQNGLYAALTDENGNYFSPATWLSDFSKVGTTQPAVVKPEPVQPIYPFEIGKTVYAKESIEMKSTAGYSNSSSFVIKKGTVCVVAKYHDKNGLYMALTDTNGKYFDCAWSNEFDKFTLEVVAKDIVEQPVEVPVDSNEDSGSEIVVENPEGGKSEVSTDDPSNYTPSDKNVSNSSIFSRILEFIIDIINKIFSK